MKIASPGQSTSQSTSQLCHVKHRSSGPQLSNWLNHSTGPLVEPLAQ